MVDKAVGSCFTTELTRGVDDTVQVGDMGQSGEIRAELAQKLLSSVGLGRQIPLLMMELLEFEIPVSICVTDFESLWAYLCPCTVGGLGCEGRCGGRGSSLLGDDAVERIGGEQTEQGERETALNEYGTAGGDDPSVCSKVSIPILTALQRSSDLISFNATGSVLGAMDIVSKVGDVGLERVEPAAGEVTQSRSSASDRTVALLTTRH